MRPERATRRDRRPASRCCVSATRDPRSQPIRAAVAADNDAVETTRRIRALASPAAQNSVVALNANVLTDQRDVYLAAGIGGVVGKPISPMALGAEIARIAARDEDDEEVSPERAARATSARSSARRAG